MLGVTISAEASSDVVVLLSEMPESLQPASLAEIHLYCYLANLLAVVRGIPASDWGYSFAITSEGFPHAEAIDRAINDHIERSIVEVRSRDVYGIPERFNDELEIFMSLSETQRRVQWIRTAALCVLNLPKGAVRSAINNSPGFRVHFKEKRVTRLLDDLSSADIYEEFSAIDEVLGVDSGELLQPAILWLSTKIMALR